MKHETHETHETRGIKMTIETVRLRLIPYAPGHLLAFIEGVERFEQCSGLRACDGLRSFMVSEEISPVWLARLRAAPAEPNPWIAGFAVLQRESNSVIGAVGFKGPPDENSVAEIAYGLVPAFHGRGYATEATEAAVGFAFGVVDPDDGLVWRWERGRESES
jgi:[ribosomal protein S5]-alanine N-acetyltransferase